MERLAEIEHAIQTGREEGPRVIAEYSKEAREALEGGVAAAGAGIATAWSEALERLRPAPRRPSAIRIIVVSIAVSLMVSALAIAVSVLWERTRRRSIEGSDEAASSGPGVRAVVPVPVASDEKATDLAQRGPEVAAEAEERISGALAS